MKYLSDQQVSDLQHHYGCIGAILSGAGLIANAPEAERISKQCIISAKQSKETLNRYYGAELAKIFGRPDFLNFIK